MRASTRLNVLRNQWGPSVSGNKEPECHLAREAARGSSDLSFSGKVVIITGAGKGIGAAAARLFASLGASVVVCDLDGIAAKDIATEIERSGGQALAIAGDITHERVPSDIVKQTVSHFGGIDIMVNNAGYTWDAVIHRTSDKQWNAMLEVHCTAPFRLIQAASPYMRDKAKEEIEGQGEASPRCIINISSTSGTHGNAGQANYATAKAGMIGLTKTVAKEWGMYNIRCNAIAFGFIDTRLTAAKEEGETMLVDGNVVKLGIPQANAFKEMAKEFIPLRRTGTAEEAAASIVMLASPWSSYITGQVLEVNGGSYM